MTNQPHGRRWSGRSRLLTTVSIIAVGLAGAVAVGANIGILSAAGDNNDVGSLSAAGDLIPAEPQVIDVYIDPPATSSVGEATDGSGAPMVETFTVDTAGTLSFVSTDAGLRLDSLEPTTGWSWVLAQSSNTELTVSLTNGARTLDVVATLAADGSVVLDVSEPTSALTAQGGGNGPSDTSSSGTNNSTNPGTPEDGGADDDHKTDKTYEGSDDDD